MNDYRAILRRVGFVLLAVGIADIAFMVYCIMNNQNYSSSLNLFAVVAAIFLIRGGLKTARVVTWFSAFMFTGLIGAMLFLVPFQKPFGLWVIEFRLDAISVIASVILSVAAMALLAWVYMQLRSPAVVAARVEAGQTAEPPKLAFAMGAVLALSLGVIMHFTLNGDAGAKAIALAKTQHGSNFDYQVTAMRWGDNHVSATLTAYNASEIKSVQVEW